MSNNNGSNEKIVSVSIAGREYKIKVRENVKERPYISLTLHLNLNKRPNLELAGYLEELSREYNVRSNTELLRRIVQEHKELRERVRELQSEIERLRGMLHEGFEEFYIKSERRSIIVKGPKIVLNVLRIAKLIVAETAFTELIETLNNEKIIHVEETP